MRLICSFLNTLFFILAIQGYSQGYKSIVLQEGNFNYYTSKEGVVGSTVEGSSVLYNGKDILVSLKKSIKEVSSTASIEFSKTFMNNPVRYSTNQLFQNLIVKDFTLTFDKKFSFALVCSPDQTNDQLVFWTFMNPEDIKPIKPNPGENFTLKSAILNSLNLHFKDSIINFKLDGLAALPNNKLLIGVTEVTNERDQNSSVFTLIEVGYTITNQGIVFLKNDFRLALNFETFENDRIRENISLVAMEFDPDNSRILFLTKFTNIKRETDMGGYLLGMSLYNIQLGEGYPYIFENSNGNVFVFDHQPGGLTYVNRNIFFILNDDETYLGDSKRRHKKTWERSPNQLSYTVIKVD